MCVVTIFVSVFLTYYVSELEQRIRIKEIRKDEWFKKDYEPVREVENEEVNLDDVNAAFDDPEVYNSIHHIPRIHLEGRHCMYICIIQCSALGFSYIPRKIRTLT